MAITKAKKVDIVKKVKEAIEEAGSVVFVNFHGLSVGDTNTLRKELRANSVRYLVAKKTLIKRALQGGKVTGELPELSGEIALAYGEDLLAPARSIAAFAKKFKDNLAIVGGIFEGTYQDRAAMRGIANIPSREVLLAQLVNLLNSPIQGLAIALHGVAEKKQ